MRTVLLALLLLLAPSVYAHKPSDSYLQLTPSVRGLTGEWRIALRDLETAIGLDRDGDRQVTWGELRSQHGAIESYALSRLRVSTGDAECQIRAGAQLVDDLSDGTYTVLPLDVTCAQEVTAWTLDYALLFDIDPTHRGLVTLRGASSPQTFALSPQRSQAVMTVETSNAWRQFNEMLREGVWHIWIGFDHILFLLALLLPAGLRATRAWNGPGKDESGKRWAPLVKDVLVLVTAFTIAHSITLSLAALELVSLPPRLIETAIAVSIVVAGLRLRYAISRPAAWIAFGFGLIHGFGFANVLADLQLPSGSLAVSLFAFNLGVELGQCAIVLAVLPLIRLAQQHWFYRRAFIPAAAVIIAAIGVVWSLERGAGIQLLPL
jgi:hypothetical protein